MEFTCLPQGLEPLSSCKGREWVRDGSPKGMQGLLPEEGRTDIWSGNKGDLQSANLQSAMTSSFPSGHIPPKYWVGSFFVSVLLPGLSQWFPKETSVSHHVC